MSDIENPTTTSERNCFGIKLEDCFRTAAFGGNRLTIDNGNTPTPDTTPKLT